MKTFEYLMLNESKPNAYFVYYNLVKKRKGFAQISRREMYEEVLKAIKAEPEILLDICTIEDIDILKNLLENDINKENSNYLQYLLLDHLKGSYLVSLDKNIYQIPSDLKNYIKMGLNVFNEQEFIKKDMFDSLIMGLIRIYNVIYLEDLPKILNNYHLYINTKELETFLLTRSRFTSFIGITKENKRKVVFSLEYMCYKDVLKLRNEEENYYLPNIQQVLNIGKYKIDFFNQKMFNFILLLEKHFDNEVIEHILNSLNIYAGLNLDDLNLLRSITGNVDWLTNIVKEIIEYLPNWVRYGNPDKII